MHRSFVLADKGDGRCTNFLLSLSFSCLICGDEEVQDFTPQVRARLWVKLCTDVASQKSGVLTSVLRGGFLRHLNLAAKKQYRRAGQKDSSVANGAVNFSAAR